MLNFGFAWLAPDFSHSGFGGIMLISVLARLLIFLGIILFGIRRHKRFGGCRNSALGILDEKYASGEITEEDYMKRKSVLTNK